MIAIARQVVVDFINMDFDGQHPIEWETSSCTIAVGDDGIGAMDKQIEKLNYAPHYMVCDEMWRNSATVWGCLL